MSKDYKPKIKKFPAMAIKMLFSITSSQINRIEDDYAKDVLGLLVKLPADIVDALADKDPNDKEQMRVIVDGFLNQSDFVEVNEQKLAELISKIDHIETRKTLLILLPVPFDILKLLFDSNTDNVEQIKQKLDGFLKSPQMFELFKIWISALVKDEPTASMIVEMLEHIIKEEV